MQGDIPKQYGQKYGTNIPPLDRILELPLMLYSPNIPSTQRASDLFHQLGLPTGASFCGFFLVSYISMNSPLLTGTLAFQAENIKHIGTSVKTMGNYRIYRCVSWCKEKKHDVFEKQRNNHDVFETCKFARMHI